MSDYFKGSLLGSAVVNSSSGDTWGTHHSVLGVGGYLEVETMAERNSIPVDYDKGLEYDGLSSGRRRYNMLVNVIETGITYQLNIPYGAWTAFTGETQKIAALADNNNWVLYGQNVLTAGAGIDSTELAADSIALDLSAYTAPANIAITIDTGSTTFIFTDNSTSPKGIQYAVDNSLTANPLSLMPKSYIDATSAGFDPKESVFVATTTGNGNIDLTGGTFSSGSTIDGVVVNDGWRVLIKNQTGATENGIYVYSASTSGFTRSTDFDGTPTSEVSSGAFTNVITGATLYNTQWMVIGTDPIVIGVDDINWTLSHQAISHIEGVGISITANTISLDGTGTAGNNIDWSGTQYDVNVSGGTLGSALDAKTNVSLFNSYTGTTDTILSDLRTDLDTVSGQTDTNTTDIANLVTNTITGATNIGNGIGIYSGTSGNLFNLRSISGGTGIDVILSGDTILLSGSSAPTERIEQEIFQTTHNFELGDVLGFTGGSYYLPVATLNGGESLGIVSNVIDNDNFTITYNGYISGISGVTGATGDQLSASTVYYLSESVAGKVTHIQPTTQDEIVKPMFITLTNDDANVVNYRGDIVTEPDLDDFMSNVGGAQGEVFSGSSGNTHFFRTLSASTGIDIVTNGDRIDITNLTTVTNIGTGEGDIFHTGSTLPQIDLRTIKAGDAITVATVGNIITLDVDTGLTKVMNVVTDAGVAYSASTTNEFIGIFSGSSGRVVYLPPVPIIGKPITVSDVSGDGNAENITINGAGINIDDAPTAIINTDFGSTTLLYTGTIWKVIAFA